MLLILNPLAMKYILSFSQIKYISKTANSLTFSNKKGSASLQISFPISTTGTVQPPKWSQPRNDPQPWNDPQIDPEMIPTFLQSCRTRNDPQGIRGNKRWGKHGTVDCSVIMESKAILAYIYLLLTEFEGRTVSYGPSFFLLDLWPKRSARGP